MYNCALQERIDAWKTCRKSVSYYDQARQLKPMRAEGLIGVANYSCCQDILRRLNNTFNDFFTRIKRGKKAGFPRFKASRRWDTLTFPYGDGCGFNGKLLRIQGVGEIKVKFHRSIDGKIKTVSIHREAGYWYVLFAVACEATPLATSPNTVGIDVGLASFATLDDGTEIDNPRFAKETERKLRITQRRVSRRRNKKSKRRCKAVQILQRQYIHIENQRRDFHHKISRMIVNRYGFIAVEDLNIKGLSSGMLAKSVHDAGWGQFLNMLAYKAESAGREFVKVNPRGTSQTCLCGQRVSKTLSERWHLCPSCGLSQSRDHVSAQLILRLGLSLHGLTWSDVETCVPCEALLV